MMRNVNTSRPMPNGISSWRITYRSIIFINDMSAQRTPRRNRTPDYDARRTAVAHAPALLPGSGDGRTHPPLGAIARPQGLLGNDCAAARVPGRADHVQPRPVDARPTGGVRARRCPRPIPGPEPEAGGPAVGGGTWLLRRELLPRASTADDRPISALCRIAGAARIGWQRRQQPGAGSTLLCRRHSRSAGLAQAGLGRSVLL